jgi:putative ABC transport system permease protein
MSLRFQATVRVALDTLRANPLRTLLSTLGIVMGAASLAAVLALGDGAQRFARQRLELEGMQTIAIAARTADQLDGIRVPRTDYPTFTPDDAADLAAGAAAGQGVALTVQGSGVATIGGAARGVVVTGLLETAGEMPGVLLARGRRLTAAEAKEGSAVVLVSDSLARALSPGGASSPVGSTLRLRDRDFRVVGVLQRTPGERQLGAVVPFTAADSAMMPAAAPRVPTLYLNAARVEDTEGMRPRVESWVAARGWKGRVDIQMRGPERLRQMASGILLFKILMGAFTAISLLVGGIGIMNVLLASVAERTREIGIRKAIGASRRIVVGQFLSESVAISLAGSVLGVCAGLAGAAAVTAVMRARTDALIYTAVTWQTVTISLAAAALVGLLFGTYPALRASRLSPLDAIQRD